MNTMVQLSPLFSASQDEETNLVALVGGLQQVAARENATGSVVRRLRRQSRRRRG